MHETVTLTSIVAYNTVIEIRVGVKLYKIYCSIYTVYVKLLMVTAVVYNLYYTVADRLVCELVKYNISIVVNIFLQPTTPHNTHFNAHASLLQNIFLYIHNTLQCCVLYTRTYLK